MTREQLADRFRAASKRISWILGPWLAVFIAALFLLSRGGSNEPMSAVGLVGFFAFLGLNLVAVVTIHFRLMRRYELFCPNCNKVLNSEGLRVALATGACNRCKGKFLEGGDSDV